jgi:predicted aspartyl protease
LYTCEVEKDNESDSTESINEEMKNFQNDTSELIENNTPRISLASITRITQPKTLKLKGHIKNYNVTILIDTGSTHYFLDIKIARKLKLFVYPVPDMKVMVADGKQIRNARKFHKVKLQIQDFNLESELFTIPLGGVYVVLGVQWLQTLGTYSVNHQEHFIQFKWQGKS